MTRKKKTKYNPEKAMLSNSTYSVKGAGNRRLSKTESAKLNSKITKESKDNLNKGMKMAEIEAYAKKHKITIAQAMIKFMD